jgi:hypothetical protein
MVIAADKAERDGKETAVAHFEVHRSATHSSVTDYIRI